MTTRRNLFIVLEGIDGTGKSAVAPQVAEMLEARINCRATVCATPLGPFLHHRDSIDGTEDALAHYYFYLASVMHASAEIRRLLATTSVVCDRYVFSTQAYHLARGVEVMDLKMLNIALPDLGFLLTAREEVRTRRLKARRITKTWDKEPNSPGSLFSEIESLMAAMGLVEVNTSDRSINQVAEYIVDCVESLPIVKHDRRI